MHPENSNGLYGLDSETLFIKTADDFYEPLGKVTDVEMSSSETYDIPDHIFDMDNKEAIFETTNEIIRELLLMITGGVREYIAKRCPNKKVVYLMLYGKNKKIRKKNLNRAIKILKGM